MHVERRVVEAEIIWAGMRRLVEGFRAGGLQPGERIVVALQPGPTMLAAIGAAMWEDLTIVPAAPDDAVATAQMADASMVLVADGDASCEGALHLVWDDPLGGPDPANAAAWRAARIPAKQPPTPAARLVVPASGGEGAVALSDDNLLVVLEALGATLDIAGRRWLSTLAWHTAEGIALEVLPALLLLGELVRPSGTPGEAERWADAVAGELARTEPVGLVATVPMLRTLIERSGIGALANLDDGLVIGPGVDEALAAHLATTRLRASRGAAELSGLVTVGERGTWRAGLAGRAMTCVATSDGAGGLNISGRALALGTFDEGRLVVLDPRRSVAARFI